MKENYFLRCRECGKKYPNQPQSYCEECFSPLEVSYDYEAVRLEKVDLEPVPPTFRSDGQQYAASSWRSNGDSQPLAP